MHKDQTENTYHCSYQNWPYGSLPCCNSMHANLHLQTKHVDYSHAYPWLHSIGTLLYQWPTGRLKTQDSTLQDPGKALQECISVTACWLAMAAAYCLQLCCFPGLPKEGLVKNSHTSSGTAASINTCWVSTIIAISQCSNQCKATSQGIDFDTGQEELKKIGQIIQVIVLSSYCSVSSLASIKLMIKLKKLMAKATWYILKTCMTIKTQKDYQVHTHKNKSHAW